MSKRAIIRALKGALKYGAVTSGIGGAVGAGVGASAERDEGGTDMAGAAVRGGLEGAKIGPATGLGVAMSPLFPIGPAIGIGALLSHVEMAKGAAMRPRNERRKKLAEIAADLRVKGEPMGRIEEVLRSGGAEESDVMAALQMSEGTARQRRAPASRLGRISVVDREFD